MTRWLFHRDPDRVPRPKAWTAGKPPRPYSRRIFDLPTILSLWLIVAGLTLLAFAPNYWPVWGMIALGSITLVIYCGSELRRWSRERRWLHSPGPTDTLDDL